MRIISGQFRGRRLRTVEGQAVRPTSDRLRETLFNILGPAVAGSQFLDLCAGSGAVGIEALSRGAAHATFVDKARRAMAVIETNLRALDLGGSATLVARDALAALGQLEEAGRQFDIVYFDPPYQSALYDRVLGRLAGSLLLAEGAVVIAEHHAKVPLADRYDALCRYREVRQGDARLSFYGMTRPEGV